MRQVVFNLEYRHRKRSLLPRKINEKTNKKIIMGHVLTKKGIE